jgi:hypothetical protein
MDSSVLTEAPKSKPTRDPISREPGTHTTSTGAGAASGGGVVKSIAAAINAAAEQTHGHEEPSGRTFLTLKWNFEDYSRAYRFGADGYNRSQGRSFDDAEPEMKLDWERAKGNSHLPWEHAKYASRDAWHGGSDSLERACFGDSERDGN